MILGFDEVGRGAWAGPLVVGACLLADDCQIPGLTDSKKLTARQRQSLDALIREQALGFGLGWVEAKELDQLGMAQALRLAAKRALTQINPTVLKSIQQFIVDGTVDFVGDPRVATIKKADLLIPSVSAAAILAKVARDQFMINLAHQNRYQGYGFDKHVGYGTKAHLLALEKFGPTEQHRFSFRPILTRFGTDRMKTKSINQATSPSNSPLTATEFATIDKPTKKTNSRDNLFLNASKAIGNWGELEVANWLRTQNFEILTQNWRTKLFEIDIVAKQNQTIYLIEVKTRRNDDFGGGAAAINHLKLQKLHLAAETVAKKYSEADIALRVIFVTGRPNQFKISQLIEV